MEKLKVIKVLSRGRKPQKFQTINATGLTFPIVKQVPLYLKQKNILTLIDYIEEGKVVDGVMFTLLISPNIEGKFLSLGKEHFIDGNYLKNYEEKSTSSADAKTESKDAGKDASKINLPAVVVSSPPVAVTKDTTTSAPTSLLGQVQASIEEIKTEPESHFPTMVGAASGLALGMVISKVIPLPKFITVALVGIAGAFAGKKYYDVEKAKNSTAKVIPAPAEAKKEEAIPVVEGVLPLDEITAKLVEIEKSNNSELSDEMKAKFADFYKNLTDEERKISSDITNAMCAAAQEETGRRKKYILSRFDQLRNQYGKDKMEALKEKMEEAKLQF